MTAQASSQQRWARSLAQHRARLGQPPTPLIEGRLTRMVGLTLEAVGCAAPVGSRCTVIGAGNRSVEAEVVGFANERLYLMPSGSIHGLTPQARVVHRGGARHVPIGDALLGRVLDGSGRMLDGKPRPEGLQEMPLETPAVNPLSRQPIRQALDVGVRSINALLTIGCGQRMGLFAGTGVGKSVLLGMMTRYTNADVIVVGLIGERGREVQEFIQDILGEEGLARSVVVAAPADAPPLMRLRGASLAHRIAEHFRDQGRQVLLLMDSLTRYAQAQREIALAIGEPPATKGYPPSCFALLPRLVERSGNDSRGNSITAFYTVLTEGDDQQDPIADAARGILDGHIALDRNLAESGLYPAIDVEASISRVMPRVTDERQQMMARRFKRIYSTYQRNRDLINVGAYARGSDPAVEEAIDFQPRLEAFLSQPMNQRVPLNDSLVQLQKLLGGT